MRASELSISDIGKTFRSTTYPNNNKTARPVAHYNREKHKWVWGEPTEWTLTTLYAHANGNIKINNSFHLRADTELERIEN